MRRSGIGQLWRRAEPCNNAPSHTQLAVSGQGVSAPSGAFTGVPSLGVVNG